MSGWARTDTNIWRIVGWGTLAALLIIPAIGMLLTDEINWGPGDFLVMGLLFSAVGFGVEFAVRHFRSRGTRLLASGAIVLAFLLVWAELAVGIFG